jgi:succinyl-diaminopimelate desuccinylase
MTMGARETLLSWIEQDRDKIIGFLQGFTRIDTSNPPGDTRAGAAHVANFLEKERLAFRTVAPKEDNPNLVASVAGTAPRRHLVLNGHIDVFPIGDRSRWTRDPLGGELADGRVWGRGTVDMKAGTTASIFTYLYLSRLIGETAGKLTLTVVSDEETGGRWGADYLTAEMGAEVLGDCVLNAEPSSPHTVRFGEKCMFWLKLKVRTKGGHGAYPHLSASATRIAASVIEALAEVETVRARMPDHVVKMLAQPEVIAAYDRGLGKGAANVAQRVTLNIGTLSGGVLVNMLPGECDIGVDIRLPPGITSAEMLETVRRITAHFPEVSIELPPRMPVDPTLSDPGHPMLGILQDTAEELIGARPAAVISLGGTDCRFWRRRGVPAFVYGPSPEGMGGIDEGVRVDEVLHVLRTHTLSAWRWLSESDG